MSDIDMLKWAMVAVVVILFGILLIVVIVEHNIWGVGRKRG